MTTELYASVDWITVTAKSQQARDKLLQLAKKELDRAITGSKRLVMPFSFMGYKGWSMQHIQFGEREDSCLVMLSGSPAGQLWRDFALTAENISRLDLAVTFTLEKPDSLLLINYWDNIEQSRANGKRPKTLYTIIFNSKGGQTLYVGSRESSLFGRIYDKGIQDRELQVQEGKIWRWEVEIKKPKALVVAREMVLLGAEWTATMIGGYVWDFFNERWCKPRFPKTENILVAEYHAEATSEDAKLKWLTTQVKPTVHRLINAGLQDEVLSALSLDGVVNQRFLNWQVLPPE